MSIFWRSRNDGGYDRTGRRKTRLSSRARVVGMLLVLQACSAEADIGLKNASTASSGTTVATQCLSTAGVCSNSDDGAGLRVRTAVTRGDSDMTVDEGGQDGHSDAHKHFAAYSAHCQDRDESQQCVAWFNAGECDSNPLYMLYHCAYTCGSCTLHERTTEWGVEQLSPSLPPPATARVHNSTDKLAADTRHKIGTTLHILRRTQQYMDSIQQLSLQASDAEAADTLPITSSHSSTSMYTEQVMSQCQNKNESCSLWAAEGFCSRYLNLAYMIDNCAPACQFCHLINPDIRCPEGPTPAIHVDEYGNVIGEDSLVPAISPGSWDTIFQSIIDPQGQFTAYNATVLSRPENKTAEASADIGEKQPMPWIVTLDNFLSPEECQHLINLGEGTGYDKSYEYSNTPDESGKYPTVYTKGRTSSNTWRDPRSDDVVNSIMDRMTDMTGITWEYTEDFQLLKYSESQRYEEHHDYTKAHLDIGAGARVLTFFLYLNNVEEGGGTKFTRMTSWNETTQTRDPLVVTPKPGRAVLWTNVLDVDNDSYSFPMHDHTWHEALPVIQGQKYGANVWFHMHKFKIYFDRGCRQ